MMQLLTADYVSLWTLNIATSVIIKGHCSLVVRNIISSNKQPRKQSSNSHTIHNESVYRIQEKVLLKFKVSPNIQHKNRCWCLNMAAVMSREIIFPNLMKPNQLLIMHEQNVRSLLGSKREEMERTTLGRHFYRLLLLVFTSREPRNGRDDEKTSLVKPPAHPLFGGKVLML